MKAVFRAYCPKCGDNRDMLLKRIVTKYREGFGRTVQGACQACGHPQIYVVGKNVN